MWLLHVYFSLMFAYGISKHQLIRKEKTKTKKKQQFVSNKRLVPECVVGIFWVKANTFLRLKSLPQICHCSLKAFFSWPALLHHFIPQQSSWYREGDPRRGWVLWAHIQQPSHRGSPIDRTFIHCFLLFIQRSLLYANIHSGHRVETQHQLP